jgi:hypothetical protein
MLVIVVMAVFMLVGRGYVGTWLFYISVAVVILLGLARIRRKLVSSEQLAEFREERLRFEDDLARLQSERDRIQGLSAHLNP